MNAIRNNLLPSFHVNHELSSDKDFSSSFYCEISILTLLLFTSTDKEKKRRRKEKSSYVITEQTQTQFSFNGSRFILLHVLLDEENIPVKTIVAVAGRNLTLPCPGVNEQSLIDTLTWKTTQTIAKYINGMPMVQSGRVSKLKVKRSFNCN